MRFLNKGLVANENMFFVKLAFYFSVAAIVHACSVYHTRQELGLKIGENYTACVEISNSTFENSTKCITFIPQYPDVVQISSAKFNGSLNSSSFYMVNVIGVTAGKTVLSAKCDLPNRQFSQELLLLIRVHRSTEIRSLSLVMGWLYFISWASCAYPQVISNFVKKSVVGLNFDYVLFTAVGHIVYTIFNTGVYFIPLVKQQYKERYPRGIDPVRPNDILFSVHGILITLVTIAQCIIYERAKQAVSITAAVIVSTYFLSIAIFTILASIHNIIWLDVLYLCSYIKLYGTIIKYIPQAYMNYKLRSTAGFNIIGVCMDFIGSIFSILQILLDGYNYGDWKAFEENPTKLGLGIISFVFSIFFVCQHCFLYKGKSEPKIKLPEITLNSYERKGSSI